MSSVAVHGPALALPESAARRGGVIRPSRPTETVPALARWLLPNLTAAVFAVALLQVLLISGSGALFRDSDTGWHVRTGEMILTHQNSWAIPSTDPYSFTR